MADEDEMIMKAMEANKKRWKCKEESGGISCKYEDNPLTTENGEVDRTVLLSREGRVRIKDDNNDIELGGIE